MNAIALLKSDHRTVEGLFKKVESSKPGEHPAIFQQIKTELEVHAHIEEAILYPSLQEEGDKALVESVSEALQEHAQAKVFLGELSVLSRDRDKFEPLLTKLIEDVRHHVKEEEGEMFPMVEKQFDAESLDILGSQLKAEQEDFKASAESAHN